MRVCTSRLDYKGGLSGVLTLGIFDGFHLGHQKIVQKVVSLAQHRGRPSILMTFDPHPLKLLRPHLGVERLFPSEDLIHQASVLGLEYLVIENFSQSFSRIPAPVFFEQYIYKTFRPSCVVAGYDLRFGFNREGCVQKLQKWAEKHSFEVEKIRPVKIKGKIISTSILREAFTANDFDQMSCLMGRPFSLRGDTAVGEGRGAELGFPTINIKTSSRLPHKRGVYICLLHMDQREFSGVMNIGVNPTFSRPGGKIKVEVHLLGACPPKTKCKKVQVDVLSYVRDEKKFDSIDSLKKEIRSDVMKAKAYFQNKDAKKT